MAGAGWSLASEAQAGSGARRDLLGAGAPELGAATWKWLCHWVEAGRLQEPRWFLTWGEIMGFCFYQS